MEAIPFGEDEPTQFLEMPRKSTFETEKGVREQPAQSTPKETPGHDLIHASNRAIHPEVCIGLSIDTLLSYDTIKKACIDGKHKVLMISRAHILLDQH